MIGLMLVLRRQFHPAPGSKRDHSAPSENKNPALSVQGFYFHEQSKIDS